MDCVVENLESQKEVISSQIRELQEALSKIDRKINRRVNELGKDPIFQLKSLKASIEKSREAEVDPWERETSTHWAYRSNKMTRALKSILDKREVEGLYKTLKKAGDFHSDFCEDVRYQDEEGSFMSDEEWSNGTVEYRRLLLNCLDAIDSLIAKVESSNQP